jgi:hypothetical protein
MTHAPDRPQCKVGSPGDRYEQEADRIAARVMRAGESTPPAFASAEARASNTAGEPGLVPPGGRALDSSTRGFMEERFGWNFSHVRVHTGAEAGASSRAVHARAFTLGNDIVFGPGEYQPHSTAGRSLLAHELTHVVQQASGGPVGVVQRQFLRPPIPIMRCHWRRRPSGSATPNRGITVSWSGNRIDIRARIRVTGPRASAAVAEAMRRDIERMWNATFPDGYASTCQVDMQLSDTEDPSRAVINVGLGGSVAESSTLGSTMYFVFSGSASDLVWSPAHEFGHLLGLRDRRTRTFWEAVTDAPERSEAGYERNIMGAIPQGDINRRSELVVESRNVRDWLGEYAMERRCGEPVPTA